MAFDPTFLWFPGSALIAMAVLGLSSLLARKRPDSFLVRAGVPLGIASGSLAGEWGIFGPPDFPPRELSQWIAVLTIGAGLLGILQVIRPGGRDFRWGIRALGGGLVLMMMLRFRTTEAEIGIVAATTLFLWWNLERLAGEAPGRLILTAMGLAGAGLAACLLLSGSVVLAERAGILAFALLGAFAVIGRGTSVGLAYGGVGVFLAGFVGSILGGLYDSELTLLPVLFLYAAPLVPWLGRLPRVRDLRPWVLATIQVVLMLACVGSAVGLALASRPAAPADDEAAFYKSL